MTFDDWMRSVEPKHKLSDDNVQTRLLRRCWEAAASAERDKCVAERETRRKAIQTADPFNAVYAKVSGAGTASG